MANVASANANAKKNAKAAPKALTKAQLKQRIADETGLSAKQVASVMDKIAETCMSELNRKGVGVFTIPGLVKVRKVFKPATKEKQGTNPLTKQPMTIKAKPARNVVRVRALKALKDCVS